MAFVQLTSGHDNHAPQPTADQIEGLSGNDTIRGGAGGDIIAGGSSEWRVVTDNVLVQKIGDNDLLLGDEDNDWFWIGAGKDTIDGGAGFNRIEFAFSNITVYAQFEGFYTETLCSLQDIVVNLKTGTYKGNVREGTADVPGGVIRGTAQGTLANIQEVQGSMLGDRITGGNALNDALERFRGLGGNDTIDGGSGFDQLTYFGAFAGQIGGVVVNFTSQAAGTATDDFGATDTFKNIEAVIGSRFNDTLTGSTGTQTFSGSDGADSIDGKGGIDLVDFRFDGALAGVSVNLQSGTATDGFGKTDTLVNIEQVRGTFFNDSLQGDVLSNTLFGLSGNDTILGGAGNDTLHGDDGDDSLEGGLGKDVLLGWDGNDRMLGLEGDDSLEGMGGNDTLVDTIVTKMTDALNRKAGNTLNGGEGNDSLFGIGFVDGGEGNDTVQGLGSLKGGSGDDLVETRKPVDFDHGIGFVLLEGGTGKDTLKGSSEYDVRASYEYSAAGVQASLETGTAKVTSADSDILINITGLVGSNFDDGLIGSGGGDFLSGRDGNDRMKGFAGRDLLLGDKGNDTVQGGTGNDTVEGGDGADSIAGDDGDDILGGGAGNDTIVSGNGTDTVSGGSGNDNIRVTDFANVNGGSGNDTVIVAAGALAEISGGSGADRFVFISTGGSILDFDTSREKINLSAMGYKNFAAVLAAASEQDDFVRIDFEDGFLDIVGVALSDLAGKNFIL